jgi:hypothetical protein
MRREYRVTLSDGQSFLLSADMAEASANMSVNWSGEEDGWVSVPYQSANASQRIHVAAQLCASYAHEPGDSTEIESIEQA